MTHAALAASAGLLCIGILGLLVLALHQRSKGWHFLGAAATARAVQTVCAIFGIERFPAAYSLVVSLLVAIGAWVLVADLLVLPKDPPGDG